MRLTTVPAQVTTVEDRIAGSLGMSQLVLLFIPVILGSLLYATLPPGFHSAPYKVVILVALLTVCGILAIRVKGKVTLFWIIVLLRYWLRPRYYVFDKHSLSSREPYHSAPGVSEKEVPHTVERAYRIPSLSLEAVAKAQELIENPVAHLTFETRKGGLYVRITEVK